MLLENNRRQQHALSHYILSSDRQVFRAIVSGVDEPMLDVECEPKILIIPSFSIILGILQSLDETTTLENRSRFSVHTICCFVSNSVSSDDNRTQKSPGERSYQSHGEEIDVLATQ
ncbi:hypothetical protein L3Y34_012788 [Caenorhabditis briggsae]|uniref:Uncharacterized protein n=1 Tax=Caenorhabditis briggsae TaxID=6238 RepID=A0AAE9CWA7_CAEBR|nr:hypothetical protein L3Y34_012788 [Caenorhabditis briggsae]